MELEEYLRQNPKKHIIFDFDDTIFMMGKGGMPAWIKTCRIADKYDHTLKIGLPDTPTSIYLLINKSIEKFGEPIKNEFFQHLNNFESKLFNTEKLNIDLIEFIKNNSTNYQYSIWSSNTIYLINYTLEKYKLKNLFTKVIGRDSVHFGKPYSEGFIQISKDRDIEKKDYLMVGDSNSDEQSAKNAGIDFYKVEKDEVEWC